MKKLTHAIIAFLSFLCVPLCAQTVGKKPTVVIVPFEAKSSGIGQDDCDIITESFESEYARIGSALVVNRSTLKKIQTEQAFQNSDWSNNDKTAKLGEALNAQQLVFGSLRFYNNILFVTVQVQDITTLAVLASVNVRVKDTMELLDKIPEMGKNLAAEADSVASQASRKKSTIVIMPFESKSGGIVQDDCDIITESFESEYARTGSALLVNRSTLKKIQTEQAFQNSDWSNNDKTAKLGEALNAQQIVFGSLRIYNGILFVIVQVQDIKTLAVLASMHMQIENVMELLDTIPAICKNIAAQMQGESVPAVVPKNALSTKPVQTAKSGAGKVYKIGDEGPGGGWVFYYSEEGFEVHDGKNGVKVCHYLEVSKEEIGIIRWCPDRKNYGCRPMTKNDLGYGLMNTYNIVISRHKESLYTSNCAAFACFLYRTNTTKAGEWFLPTIDELDLLYKNFGRQILQGTSTGYSRLYSSSLQNDGYPSYLNFANGACYYEDKNASRETALHFGVVTRAVRAF